MPSIFISYNYHDELTAARLAKDLQLAGHKVWFAKDRIRVGDSIPEKIDMALSASDYLIALLSPKAMKSPWVRDELSAAKMIEIQQHGVFILPALLEEVEIPPLLKAKRYADFRTSYEQGLQELTDVFERTVALSAGAERYRSLEVRWSAFLENIDEEIGHLLTLTRRRKEHVMYVSREYSNENIRLLGERIRNGLDVYRALRPLEQSPRLAALLDERALLLGALAGAEDIRLQILQSIDPKTTPVTLNHLLDLGITQAINNMENDATWTFRIALRLKIEESEDWTDAVFALTYRLSRVIAWLHLEEQLDLAISLLVCRSGDYLRNRCSRAIACFKQALVAEIPWNFSSLNDRVSYGKLMEAVGFWKEAIEYLREGRDALLKDTSSAERVSEIERALDTLESRRHTIKLNVSPIRCIPPLMTEFGTRQRMDELIASIENDFWKAVVITDDRVFPAEFNRLIP